MFLPQMAEIHSSTHQGLGRRRMNGDCPAHICSKVYHHSIDSSSTTIYPSFSRHPEQLHASFGNGNPKYWELLSTLILASLRTLILSSPEPHPVSTISKPMLSPTGATKLELSLLYTNIHLIHI